MNDSFNTWYLALLRKQVEDEIQFLKTNGHDKSIVTQKCMFCVRHHATNQYHCRRMKDLEDFHEKIMYHIRANGTARGRVPIGFEAKSPMQQQQYYETNLSHSELPLISVEL